MIQDLINKIKSDEIRNDNFLHLTANEARMSETARMFLGSRLSERYYAGAGDDGVVDFGLFTQVGFSGIAALVTKAENAAKDMLGARIVNLNCLSGIHAMMCAIFSTTVPGDTIMTLNPDEGGHFATKGIVERLGRKNVFAEFDRDNLEFKFETTARIFSESGAKVLYLDPMYYIKPFNLKKLRKAIGKKAIIIYDASHTIGLIMGQTFQSPLKEGADVLCANTHKSLPGPQKGLIAFKNKTLGQHADSIIKGSISSVHTHHMIALAITILEMKSYGKAYARQVIANANAIGCAFIGLGYGVRKASSHNLTENHQVHIFIDTLGERLSLYKKLLQNNVSTNFAYQPGKRLYMRLGTQEITRRGMKEKDMKQIAIYIDRALNGEYVKNEVIKFNKRFSRVHYSFDKYRH